MKGLIFTYVLTYGGALVALVNPFYGLLIYVCFAIIKPQDMWSWSVPQGNYSRIVAVALLVGWGLKGFGKWQFHRARGVVISLVGFWLWAAIGAALAPDRDVAMVFVEALAKIVLPFLVGITTIDSVRKLQQLAWVILLSQSYVAFEMNLSYLSGYNRVYEIGFAGYDNNSVSIAMVTCVGLAFFLGLYTPIWWQKAVAFASAASMAHVVLIAFSRGGMLALIFTGIAAFLVIPKRPQHYLALVVVVVVGLRLAGPEVRQRFQTIFADSEQRDFSSTSRLQLWGNCIDAMKKRPLFGVGPNHWPLVVHEYGWPKGKEAHTLWLQTGAELGVPGILMLMSFYGLCVIRLFPLSRPGSAVPDRWLRYLAAQVIASLTGFAVSAQFVSLETLEVPFYITLVGAGVLKLATAPPARPESYPPIRHAPARQAAVRVNTGREAEVWLPPTEIWAWCRRLPIAAFLS
jgi:probable O-glycosylation ligase (exosortase A-associated)